MSEIHIHKCTECFEGHWCEMDCSLEFNGAEPPRGGHIVCEKCEAEKFVTFGLRRFGVSFPVTQPVADHLHTALVELFAGSKEFTVRVEGNLVSIDRKKAVSNV